MKKQVVCFLLFFVSTVQAVDLTLSDASIDWNEETFVTLTVSNLTPGADVELALYVDLNKDGIAQTSVEPLVFAHDLADGATNHVLDRFAIGDRDRAANGVLSARISYHGLYDQIIHTAGSYLWMARSGDETVWQPFAINPPVGAYCIQGKVEEWGASKVPSASMVSLEFFNDDNGPGPQVWAQTNGTFEICLPSSISPVDLAGVGAAALGHLSSDEGPSGEPLSIHYFTNAISEETTVLDRPLYVAPVGMIGDVELVSLSGQALLAGNGETNVLPGVLVYLEVWDGEVWSLDVTDDSGTFRMPVPKEADVQAELVTAGYDLTVREVVGTFAELNGNVTGPIITNLICRPGEFMVQGVATNAAGTGIAGLDLEFVNDGMGLFALAATDAEGVFEGVASGGSGWVGRFYEDSALAQGYLSPGDSPSTTVVADMIGMDVLMPKGFSISGTVYDNETNTLFGGEVYANEQGGDWWVADTDVNLAGQYRLRVAGDAIYNLSTSEFTGYANETLENIVAVEGGSTTGRNFHLGAGGRIRGTITGGGSPIYGWVSVYRDNGSWLEYFTDVDANDQGEFEVTVDPGSDYVLYANADEGDYRVGEYYNDTFDSSLAQRFNLSAGEVVTNVHFDLALGGAVSGTLTVLGEAPRDEWINVSLWQNTGAGWKWIAEDWVGEGNPNYQMVAPAGTNYVVKSDNWQYQEEYYNNVMNIDSAQRFTIVERTTISNINIDLDLQTYTLTGDILDQQSDAPISNVAVTAWNETYTNSMVGHGSYTLSIPANEQVRLRAEHLTHEWVGEYFADTYSASDAFFMQYPANWTEVCNFVLHRTGADSDEDGIPDSQEDSVPDGVYDQFDDYSDLHNPDTDGDGFDDGDEWVAGTSPQNSSDLLSIGETVESATGRMILNWSSVPGRTYIVESSTNLLSGLWSGIYTSTATASVSSYTNILSKSHSYYRVKIAAP